MTIESPGEARLYFPHINLLRGFAASSVFLYHVIELYPWPDFPTLHGLWWFRTGWMAVDLFFVISGFVIALSLLQLQAKAGSKSELAKIFLWRRLGRIAPLYFLTCAVFIYFNAPDLVAHAWGWLHIGLHALFLHNLHPDFSGSINGVNWSIATEVQFYLLMLLTLPFWLKRSPITILLLGVGIAWLSRAGIAWYSLLHDWPTHSKFVYVTQMPMMLDEFACGIALAKWIWLNPCADFNRWKRLAIIAAALLVAAWVAFGIFWQNPGYWENFYMMTFWRTSLGITFALLLAAAVHLPPVKNEGVTYRVLYYLGDISYGIYLWHVMVIVFLQRLVSLPAWEFAILAYAIVLILATLSWDIIEKPAIRFSKAMSGRVGLSFRKS